VTTDNPHNDDARELLARLLATIAPEVDLTGTDPQASMQDELDLDSMDFLHLATALHNETGIDVPERDYPQLSTIDGFVDFVARRMASR
jgi:acyl carrier protein